MRLWLLAVLAVASAACGAQVDGDQWHQVTLRDDLAGSVTVAGHRVAPGKSAVDVHPFNGWFDNPDAPVSNGG